MTRLSIFKMINDFCRMLWLSVSSVAFYQDVYKRYSGYGLKYITMIISLTSIIYAIVIMDKLLDIKSYLTTSADDTTNPIEYLLKQWPDLTYDGHSLLKEDAEPILIHSISGFNMIIIDPNEILTKDKLRSTPIALLKDRILISFEGSDDNKNRINSINYEQIFGKEPIILNSQAVKDMLIRMFGSVSSGMLLLVFPILILIRLALHIFRNIFNITLLYGILWWIKLSPTISSTSRVVLFASGAAEIIYSVLFVTFPQIMPITIFIDYWTILLATYSIVKTIKK